jgi:hypothetical protein
MPKLDIYFDQNVAFAHNNKKYETGNTKLCLDKMKAIKNKASHGMTHKDKRIASDLEKTKA